MLTSKKKLTLYGYIFFLPFAVVFTAFRVVPLVQSLWMTLHKWDVFGKPEFIGLSNFETLFATERFWTSLWHTFYFTLLTVPPLVFLGFILALLVNSRIKFKGFFRSTFYLPSIFSISVVCLTWMLLFNTSFGFFNILINRLGLQSVNWLGNPKVAMIAIAATTTWWTYGFNFLIYLSGLQQIPTSLYEACDIEGVSAFQKLFYITIPLLKRVHILVIVLQVIASLQIFGQVYIMTEGGPGGKTRVVIQYVYEQGFRYFKMGYAQAIAFVFFIVMISISYLQIKVMTGRGE